MTAAHLFGLAWALWALSWIVASRWSARSVKRAVARTASSRVLLFGSALVWPDATSLWRIGKSGAVVLAVVLLAGFAFAWWERLHLGRFWSSGITRKEGHRLVDTGPYALVRHPIYTGLIAAALATACVQGTVPAMLGGVMMALGLWLKARLEERFLREELGAESYDAYRRRVPMLIPFMPVAG